mmetsp:Transcript_11892/g.25534  ORF Transcript_11892/g.25534 Transcript_11892/m.25534 type:complete len:570 (-) Transcript_11892:2455-4164(-)|eukprot:CAMPEP_0202899094 /NCGR_PEP_ID=MMETSP1392-20130828/7425_1 /ASSEMBLY_ACC=CAM_ASM_000868 /TAXON_ID=225041 /ORGANISM="Chlamydomonas chlamydogama, Strain SAG 11-48b" /LENGTH=569 /DNA_ID=CAMNT_0049585191 /DNA_START=22 /DNA_END=1731 /DNA_ORIENTATION=-
MASTGNVAEGSDATEPKVDFNDVFSLRRPKDAKAGLSSGLKSMAKGVVGGVAGLIAAPAIGAQKEGVLGFAKGVATGVVGAVVLPVTGVAIGTVQVVRGVVNQPEAIVQAQKGKIWDEERREWIDKPDGAIVTAESAKAAQDRIVKPFRKAAGGVDYYELLQVPRDATPDQIKKQYYILARKWHPDQNPGDATAHEKFQQLGEAYQVLGNPDLRERYDKHGAEALDVNFMDGGEFFNMLFGNDMFEHLVGELAIAAVARNSGNISQAELKRIQQVRVEKLAVNLKATLARYVQGDVDGFKAAATEEALKLASASFGETLLHSIGRAYEQQADIELGGFFGGIAAKMKASTDNVKSQFQAANAALKVYQAQQKIEAWQKEQEKKAQHAAAVAAPAPAADAAAVSAAAPGAAAPGAEGQGSDPNGTPSAASDNAGVSGAQQAAGAGGSSSDAGPSAAPEPKLSPEALAEKQRLEEAALPLMLEAMWAANVLDISSTIKKVCTRVLEDPAASKQELKQRALGLKELGVIYQCAKGPESGDTSVKDARKQMEEAMMRVMEKRAGGGGADVEEE